MNKKKIGHYLLSLRKGHYTCKQLASILNTTEKSVREWENDEVIPNINTLTKIADIYGITIDDIFECKRIDTIEDLYNKYPMLAPLEYRSTSDMIYFDAMNQSLLVYSCIKELIKKYNRDVLSRNEELELEFLFKNSCKLKNKYYEEYEDNRKDAFLSFMDLLCDLKIEQYSDDAFYYEARRFFVINNIHYQNIKPYPLFGDPTKDKKEDRFFKSLEDWEKDEYLALFQNSDMVNYSIADYYSPEQLAELGLEELSQEDAQKKLMKYFIANGACLQPWYFTYKRKNKVEHDVLIELEDIYVDYIKPLFVKYQIMVDDDNVKDKYAYVDNNEFSRFVNEYYESGYSIVFLNQKSLKEMYELLSDAKGEEDIIEILYQDIKGEGENFSYEEKRDKVLRSHRLNNLMNAKMKFNASKKDAEEKKNKIPFLAGKLSNDEYKYYDYNVVDIVKDKNFSHKSNIEYWRSLITYEEYLEDRDLEKTKELLSKIDDLSMEEIRKIYFPKEEYER